MLLPFRSKNPPESLPIITILLIVANTAIFFGTQEGLVLKESVLDRGGLSLQNASVMRVLSSMFLHGDIFHLLGNMWFLYLFGFAVEGRLGPLKFALLYLLAGAAGDVLHLVIFGAMDPTMPSIGASGAIMGCLGAALYMFPYGQVDFIFGIALIYWRVVTWHIMWVAAYYIGFDILGAIISTTGGGVAHLAHIGGALGGFLIALALRAKRDSEYVSEVKATVHATKDLTLLSPFELQTLYEANTTDQQVLLAWMQKSLRDPRGLSGPCEDAFKKALPTLMREADAKVMAGILLGLSQIGKPVAAGTLIQAAMGAERTGDKVTAYQLYERAAKANPSPEDMQAAVFRGALLLENHYFNFERAGGAYQYLIDHHPLGTFTDQARSRLGALKSTGRVR